MKTLPLIFLLAFVGCSTMSGLDVSKRTRVYQADYKTVFKAALALCRERSFLVLKADTVTGIIGTGWREIASTGLGSRMKMNFDLTGQGPTTKVILSILAEDQGIDGRYSPATTSPGQAIEAYSTIFDAIQKKL